MAEQLTDGKLLEGWYSCLGNSSLSSVVRLYIGFSKFIFLDLFRLILCTPNNTAFKRKDNN